MKTYIVLTPEKVEEIFNRLQESIFDEVGYILPSRDIIEVKSILESKKQELLKSFEE